MKLISGKIGLRILLVVLAVVSGINPAMAQSPATAGNSPVAAPVPAQIGVAHKVFVSNLGADAITVYTLDRAGDSAGAYAELYSALQTWGRYQLVSSPAEADMVAEVRFTAMLNGGDKEAGFNPLLTVHLIDPHTHTVLWTLDQPVKGAYRKSTWKKNFHQAVLDIVEDWKTLLAEPAAVK